MSVPIKSAERSAVPAHLQVYQALRQRVLVGELAPGQAVTIQGLVAELSAGMTPVREAIRRLTAEGALEFQGNRRVYVPELNRAAIADLVFARLAIEPELTRRATERLTQDNLQHLGYIDENLDTALDRGDVVAYLRHNYTFHSYIHSLADAPILFQLAESLWLRVGPSLRVVCGRSGTKNVVDQHKQALKAMRVGDGESAAQAIAADITQGMNLMRAAL